MGNKVNSDDGIKLNFSTLDLRIDNFELAFIIIIIHNNIFYRLLEGGKINFYNIDKTRINKPFVYSDEEDQLNFNYLLYAISTAIFTKRNITYTIKKTFSNYIGEQEMYAIFKNALNIFAIEDKPYFKMSEIFINNTNYKKIFNDINEKTDKNGFPTFYVINTSKIHYVITENNEDVFYTFYYRDPEDENLNKYDGYSYYYYRFLIVMYLDTSYNPPKLDYPTNFKNDLKDIKKTIKNGIGNYILNDDDKYNGGGIAIGLPCFDYNLFRSNIFLTSYENKMQIYNKFYVHEYIKDFGEHLIRFEGAKNLANYVIKLFS